MSEGCAGSRDGPSSQGHPEQPAPMVGHEPQHANLLLRHLRRLSSPGSSLAAVRHALRSCLLLPRICMHGFALLLPAASPVSPLTACRDVLGGTSTQRRNFLPVLGSVWVWLTDLPPFPLQEFVVPQAAQLAAAAAAHQPHHDVGCQQHRPAAAAYQRHASHIPDAGSQGPSRLA